MSDLINNAPTVDLKVTYYDDDYEGERTITAKQVNQIKSMDFPYFEITTHNNSFLIGPLDLICIKCEVNKGSRR